MTDVTIELPDGVAEAIEKKAAEIGTTSSELLLQVVAEAVSDMPEAGADEDWKYR